MEGMIDLFQKIGLTEQRAKDTAKNKKLAPTLERTITEAGVQDGCDKNIGALLYTLASTLNKEATPHLPYLAQAVISGKLASTEQIAAAIEYVSNLRDSQINEQEFNQHCGVGVVITPEQVQHEVSQQIEQNKEKILSDRYRCLGITLSTIKQNPELKWANGAVVKDEVEKQFLALLGPKDERDQVVKGKKKEKKEKPSADKKASSAPVKKDPNSIFFEGELSRLHKPGGNKQIKDELMIEHLKATGGKVVTRFPPEPNGFLHIGHAKAININFGYAEAHNGICYLRYDDTNPEAEEEQYFISILETVKWLGFTPYKITYSSDYFQRLYELAVFMIQKDLAYVCYCTGEEIYAQRGGAEKGPRYECSHRNRPIEESLAEFEKMKQGQYKEGEAILRMKMNMQDGNPQFWDLVAYRILYTPHHRTGSEWCIYPTYDFTHCLVDSFENITHSLCTTEFTQSRPSYFWLCDAVEVYKPVQWEYGRLNVTNTVLSKRKVLELVELGHVHDWDDPRLFTLAAIRRRGVPPEAINIFVRELGVTTSKSTIDVARLDNHIRDHLNETVPRVMALLEPLKVTLTNLPGDYLEEITVPNKPRDPKLGEHIVPFTKTVYIDRSDFREQDSSDYFRLAPGKSVGLLHVKFPITCQDVVKDAAGNIVELICHYDNEGEFKKPKTYIQWVADSPAHNSPVKIDEIRLYEKLFFHANPQDKTAVPGGWLSDINPDSIQIHRGAILEVGIWDVIKRWYEQAVAKQHVDRIEDIRFQLIRIGYFCFDKDSQFNEEEFKKDPSKAFKSLILNRTVTLKEDSKKEN
ncbi:Glutaminyl-tRNA synthetase [Basidiobolus ranarum]|uniref:glutamine--tRNA ligase n=1 Tax=Basidiobolus ranarum TaxID=34480 RepID=A0ABR2X500_9FUNG